MAIESKSYTAGNNGGAFQNVNWNALMANPQSEPSPLEQVINTFRNTNGDFNAKVDAAFDDLKKVASEFVDEFYKKMQGAFDNLNELNPDFVSAEAIRGNIDKIEILEQWIEQEEKEEDVVASADEVLNQLREEAERKAQEERAEVWANSDHTYAGQKMSASQWLAAIDWFKNEDNIAAWEDQFMADTGLSRKDAKRVGGKMKRMYDLIDLQTQGKVLTREQEKELNDLSNDSDVKKGVSAQQKIQCLRNNQTMTVESETRLDALGSKKAISVTSILSDGGSVGEVNNVKSITPKFNLVAPDTKITPSPVEIKVAETPKLANTTVVLSADNMFS